MRFSTLVTAVLAVALFAPVVSAQSRQRLTPSKPDETSQTFFTPGVADGSFEAGAASAVWAPASTNFGSPICSVALCGPGGPTAAAPRTGTFYVWFGGAGAAAPAETSSVQQSVAVPAGAATLKFWLRIPAVTTAPSGDAVTVSFGGTTLATYTYAANQTAFAQYTQVSLPITGTGAAQVLRFQQTNPAGVQVSYFLDDVSIEGTVAGPGLAANPTSLSFGTAVPVGTQSAPQTVTLTNGGTAGTVVTGITSSNAAFTVQGPAFPLTIAPGASATFTVRFAPTTTAAQTGTVSVASNAPGSPLAIAVTGTGNADVTSTVPPGTTVGGPTFNRSTTLGTGASGSCTLSTTAVSVQYRALPFSVTAAGAYTITTAYPAGFDGYIFLYRTSFVPTDPCLNLVALDDDFAAGGNPAGQGSQILSQALMTGQYVLVVTGFGNGSAGTFAGTVAGPSAVSFAVAGEGTAANSRARLSAAPNPFQGTATVRFTTAVAQDVTVAVYDVTGREVAVLFAGSVAADQEVAASLSASQLPSGVYVVRATGTDLNLTQRVTVVR